MPTQTFPLTGPITLSVRVGHGSITVHAEEGRTEAAVQLTATPGAGDLLARTAVELSGSTLAVHAPRQGGLPDLIRRGKMADQGLDIVVSVPAGTAIKAASFTAPITTTGRVGRTDVGTGVGPITLAEVDGDLVLRYGSCDSTTGRVNGSVVVRSGAGNARFGEIGGDLVAGCGSGRLEADVVRGTTRSRTGSGGARLGAVFGDVDVISGSGPMSIGLPAGVTARLDVRTAAGTVRSDLPVTERPAVRQGAISVRARTANGDVHLFRAA